MLERDPSQTHVPGGTPGDAEDPTAPIGSRPAQNARQVASTSEVDLEWRGADEAADFLGLDQELRGVDPSGISALPSAPDGYAPSGQQYTGVAQSPESLRSLFSTIDGGEAGDDPLAPELATQDPFAFDESEPAPAPAQEPRKRGAGWYALRAVAALALVGLGLYAYTTYFQPAPDVSMTVQAPVRRTPPVNKPEVTTTEETLIASSSSEDLDALPGQSEAASEGAETLDRIANGEALESPLTPSPEFEQWMRDNSNSAWHGRDALQGFQTQGAGTSPFDPLHQTESIPAMRDAIAAADRSSTDSDSIAGAQTDGSTQPSPVRFNENASDDGERLPTNSRLRRATASDLAGIWEGSTVPIESIDSSTRMLTPSVGRVRTILYGGEVFEGRLYAVGQGKVWLDTELGRLALVSDQVQKLEQLASPDGTPVLGAPGSETLAGLPRVRVRTPGGMFYGKVTLREGSTVTLITDEGARITLDSPIIEPVPASRTVIVGTAPKQ